MINKFEISENSKILLSKEFDYKLIQLEGNKLNESFKKIGTEDVVEVIVHDYQDEYANFTKQIEQLNTHDGCIFMAGKFSFIITNQKIDLIRLSGKYIDELKEYQYKDIIEIYGDPDKVLIDGIEWGWDYDVNAKVLVYLEQKLYFFIDEDSLTIKEVHIGNIDETFYDPEDINIVRKRDISIRNRKKIMKWFLYSLPFLSAILLLLNYYGYLL